MRLLLLLSIVILFSGHPAAAQPVLRPEDFLIVDGRISEKVLRNYLSRNISITGLVDLNPNTGDCSRKPGVNGRPERVNGEEYACWLDFIRKFRPKFLNGITGLWGNGDLWYYFDPARPCDHFDQCRNTLADIHAIDSGIICHASLDEAVGECLRPDCIRLPVPDWVLQVYPIAPNGRDAQDQPAAFFHAADMNPQAGTETPDITRPMTQAWYYWLGCQLIDAGFEALRLGQIELTGREDRQTGWEHTYRLIRHLKAYAATHARRGLVLFESQTKGIYHGHTDNLILDLHSWPLNLKETYELSPQDRGRKARGGGREAGYDHEAVISPCDDFDTAYQGIYGRSRGGVNPSIGPVPANPYFVEFDNTGGSDLWFNSADHQPPRPNAFCHFPWSWDEITWFSEQSERYRNHFLVYAWHRVRCLDSAGYLSMVGRRPVKPCTDCRAGFFRSYIRQADGRCADGNQLADVIQNIWDAHTLPDTPAGDYRPYHRWAHGFNPVPKGRVPQGRYVAGDFNGDGQAEVLVTTARNRRPAGWQVYPPQGSITAGIPGDGRERLYTGDFNGDGRDDLLATADPRRGTSWPGWKLWLSNGTGFEASAAGSRPSFTERFFIGDYNGDGKDDFLVTADGAGRREDAWEGYQVYLSEGRGFSEDSTTGRGAWPSRRERIFPGDFNGDGRFDLLVTADRSVRGDSVWNGYLVLHGLPGGTTFRQAASGLWPSWGEEFIIGDWNGDGRDDFTVRPVYRNRWRVRWVGSKTYLGNAAGDHFIYAFDFGGQERYPVLFRHRRPDGDVIIGIDGEERLQEFLPEDCR